MLSIPHMRNLKYLSHLLILPFCLLTGKLPAATPDSLTNAQIVEEAKSVDRSQWAAFHRAAYAGDLDKLKTYLAAGIDPNFKSRHGRAALLEAARGGRLEAVQLLLEAGADVHSTSRNQWTALAHAARYNKTPEIMHLLIKHGADLTKASKDGWTPLHNAAWGNPNPIISQTLINYGAGLNAVNDYGSTPLMVAAQNNNPQVVKTILDARPDLQAKSKNGRSALVFAVRLNKNPQVTRMLIEHGFDPLETTQNAQNLFMHAASVNANPTILEVLVEHGVDPHGVNRFQQSALWYACYYNSNASVVQRLIDYGLSLDEANRQQQNLLFRAAHRNPNPEVIALLLENGLSVDTQDSQGNTPLHIAAAYNPNPEVLKILLQRGAKLETPNNYGQTPLHRASAVNKELATLKVLLEHGAQPEVKDKQGDHAFSHAVRNNSLQIVQYLFEAFPDKVEITHTTQSGDNFVILAAANNDSQVLPFVLEAGADLSHTNNQNENALHRAAIRGILANIDFLLKQGLSIHSLDRHGNTPLLLAARYTRIPPLTRLLEAGAEVNQTNKQQVTAIFHAAQAGNKETFSLLLDAGANPSAIDHQQNNIFHYLARNPRCMDIFPLLANKEPDINLPNQHGITPLMNASTSSTVQTLKGFLEAGADISAVTNNGDTVLIHFVRSAPNANNLQILLDAGADIHAKNAQGQNAAMISLQRNSPVFFEALVQYAPEFQENDGDFHQLLIASIRGNHPMQQPLLDSEKLNPDFRNSEGKPLIFIAAQHSGTLTVLQTLLGKGADIHAHDREQNTVLHAALHNREVSQILPFLLEAGLDMNARNQFGHTPLHQAIRNNRMDAAQLLVDSHADTSIQDNQGKTPYLLTLERHSSHPLVEQLRKLEIARLPQLDANGRNLLFLVAARNRASSLKSFLEMDLDINLQDHKGVSPLMIAASSNGPDEFQMLLQEGADPHAVDQDGRNLLIHAARNTRSALILKLLMDTKLDLNHQDHQGRTALMIVCQNRDPESIRLLLDAGAHPAIKDQDGKTAQDYLRENLDSGRSLRKEASEELQSLLLQLETSSDTASIST